MSDAQLKPCPFCGGAFRMGKEPHDSHYIGGMFYIYHDYGPLGSPARVCPIAVNGHFETEAKAIAAWNTRTDLAQAAVAAALERAAKLMADGDSIVAPDYPEWFIPRYTAILSMIEPTGRAALDAIVAERTKELEAKLAKAVGALEKVACGGAVPDMQIAAAILAELTGETAN